MILDNILHRFIELKGDFREKQKCAHPVEASQASIRQETFAKQ